MPRNQPISFRSQTVRLKKSEQMNIILKLLGGPHIMHAGCRWHVSLLVSLHMPDASERSEIRNREDALRQMCSFTLIFITNVHRTALPTRLRLYYGWLPVWLSGNALVSINVVTLRRTRLVPGWVTVLGRQLTTSAQNQAPRSPQSELSLRG